MRGATKPKTPNTQTLCMAQVKTRSFRLAQSKEAQEEFFEQCARVRASIGHRRTPALAATKPDGLPPIPAVEKCRATTPLLSRLA